MELIPEELHSYKIHNILKESLSIAKLSPRTFYFITVTLIFPLSFAILCHSLFTHAIIVHLSYPTSHSKHMFIQLLTIEFCYLIFLSTFSLLSTAAVVFTVASLYISKPVCFSSTLSAIPQVFKRLFITFIWVGLLMSGYHLLFFACMALYNLADDIHSGMLQILSIILATLVYLVVHAHNTALWHLASVVSVLEPVYGFAAVKKSYVLLKGRFLMAYVLVSGYMLVCGVVWVTFTEIVAYGGEDYGVFIRAIVVALLVVVLMVVNLVGLIVQSVFYYVCKSYHHQEIDKSFLYDQLGGYVAEYMPLKSDVEMENLGT